MLNQLLWFIHIILLIVAVGPNITNAIWIPKNGVIAQNMPTITPRAV